MHKSSPKIVLGFDFGMRRIGVAIGQTITKTAHPLTIIAAVDGIPQWDDIKLLIETWGVHLLIVGLPYNLDGSDQDITLCAKKFANRLKQKFKLPVYLIDERLTTKLAKSELYKHKKLKNSTKIDSYAAKIILESWLKDYDPTSL